MPTYIVSAPSGLLSASQKHRIAREVTRTHNDITQAQAFFAQVIFNDIAPGNWFVAGAPVGSDMVFLHGFVRSGRPVEMKHDLLVKLLDVVAESASVLRSRVWGYLGELPPGHMAEYGLFLPAPGAEQAWLELLPAPDRAQVAAPSHFV